MKKLKKLVIFSLVLVLLCSFLPSFKFASASSIDLLEKASEPEPGLMTITTFKPSGSSPAYEINPDTGYYLLRGWARARADGNFMINTEIVVKNAEKAERIVFDLYLPSDAMGPANESVVPSFRINLNTNPIRSPEPQFFGSVNWNYVTANHPSILAPFVGSSVVRTDTEIDGVAYKKLSFDITTVALLAEETGAKFGFFLIFNCRTYTNPNVTPAERPIYLGNLKIYGNDDPDDQLCPDCGKNPCVCGDLLCAECGQNPCVCDDPDISVRLSGIQTASAPKVVDGEVWVSVQSIAERMNLTYVPLRDEDELLLIDFTGKEWLRAKAGSKKMAGVNGEFEAVSAPYFQVEAYGSKTQFWMNIKDLTKAMGIKYTGSTPADIKLSDLAPIVLSAIQDNAGNNKYLKRIPTDRELNTLSYYLDHPALNADSEVRIWQRHGTYDNYVEIAGPVWDGSRWIGSVLYNTYIFIITIENPGQDMIVVRDTHTRGNAFEQSHVTTHEEAVRSFLDDDSLMLVATFNNISAYINGGTTASADSYGAGGMAVSAGVTYREAGTSAWMQGYPLDRDFANHNVVPHGQNQFRGSIVGLKDNTEYEVKVDLFNANGDVVKTRTETVRTETENVNIAKTMHISELPNYERGKPLLVEGISGTADGYIRIVGDKDHPVEASDQYWQALLIGNVEYLILENFTVRGGKFHGVTVIGAADNVRISNFDISDWGRPGSFKPSTGKYVDGLDREINYDAGITVHDCERVVIEKTYFHDPKGKANAWNERSDPAFAGDRNAHPAGPSAIYGRGGRGMVYRWNDLIGSDQHRWNDSMESYENFSTTGGFGIDSDLYGNYQMFGSDDSTELDGGRPNLRWYGNKVEGFLTSVSTAGVMTGPVYIFNNLATNVLDNGAINSNGGTKNGTGDTINWNWLNSVDRLTTEVIPGMLYTFHNAFFSPNAAISSVGSVYRTVTYNNILIGRSRATQFTGNLNDPSVHFDYNLGNIASSQPSVTGRHNQNSTNISYANSIMDNVVVRSYTNGDFRLSRNTNLRGGGLFLPNFTKEVTVEFYEKYLDGSLTDDEADFFKTDMGYTGGAESIFPIRPVPLRTVNGNYQINLYPNKRSETVTIKGLEGLPAGTRYEVLKNSAFDWLEISGSLSGVMGAGSRISINVSYDPAKIWEYSFGAPNYDLAEGKGAFTVKLYSDDYSVNGMSMPITVYGFKNKHAEIIPNLNPGVYGTFTINDTNPLSRDFNNTPALIPEATLVTDASSENPRYVDLYKIRDTAPQTGFVDQNGIRYVPEKPRALADVDNYMDYLLGVKIPVYIPAMIRYGGQNTNLAHFRIDYGITPVSSVLTEASGLITSDNRGRTNWLTPNLITTLVDANNLPHATDFERVEYFWRPWVDDFNTAERFGEPVYIKIGEDEVPYIRLDITVDFDETIKNAGNVTGFFFLLAHARMQMETPLFMGEIKPLFDLDCNCRVCEECGGCIEEECCGDCDCEPCKCVKPVCECMVCDVCGGCIEEECCGTDGCECVPCVCVEPVCECMVCDVCGGCIEEECCGTGDCECVPCDCPAYESDAEFLQARASAILSNGLSQDNLRLEGKVLTLVIDGREFILSSSANNRNIDGEIYLGDGYYLRFDIKGNGSNIKEFVIYMK